MKESKYTIELLAPIIKSSLSMAQALRQLGLVPAGGNYKYIGFKIKELGIDTSHFTGKGHLKNKTHNWANKIPLSEILIKNSKYLSNSSLKKRLLKEGMLENKCIKCKLTKWQEEKISLHLDHINGNNMDNRIGNLRILCPNCHSQTETYCRQKRPCVAQR